MADTAGQISTKKKFIRAQAPVIGLLVVCFFMIIKIIIPATGHMSYGFIGRYTASRLLVQGQFGPQVYNDNWFAAQVQAVTQLPIVEIFTPNLPTLSLLTLPFVGLSPQAARDIWIWVNLPLLFVTLGLLTATVPRRSTGEMWALLLAVIVATPAIAANFRVGQVYGLLLFLFTLALFGLVTRRNWLVGLALGLALVLKTSGLLFWLLLPVHKRWGAVRWAVATVLIVVLGSMPWIGIDTWLAYPQAAWNFSNRSAISFPAYQTTAGFFAHLFQFDSTWNPAPIVHCPALAQGLTAIVAGVAVVVTLWLARDKASLLNSFAALTCLNIILLPVAEAYHFVLLIIPVFILGNQLIQQPFQPDSFLWDRLLLGLALLLLIAPIPYKDSPGAAGWLTMLAYPRLLAGWLIWVAALRRLARQRPSAHISIFKQFVHL